MDADYWLKFLPLVTVLGPIAGALIGAAVTYWIIAKRKKVVFAISRTEDLTSGLRQHHHFVSFNIANRAVLSLNKATVHIRNSGNTTIKDLVFEVLIPETHEFYAVETEVEGPGGIKLRESIKIDWKTPAHPYFPHCEASVPFLNAKERFDLVFFFDGEPELLQIRCRLEDTSCKVVAAVDLFGNGAPLTIRQAIIRGLLKGLASASPLSFR